MKTVVGVLPSLREAEALERDLESLGVSTDELLIATGGRQSPQKSAGAERTIAAAAASGFGWFLAGFVPLIGSRRSAPAAAGVGALLGGLAALIAGAVGIAVAGAAPWAAGSPAITLLAVAGAGAAAGAIVAAIYNSGISHDEIPLQAEALREHGVVVAAHIGEPMEAQVLRMMRQHRANHVRSDVDTWIASGWTGEGHKRRADPSDSTARSDERGRFPTGWGR
ncbi:MAG: hypothetical protein KGN84_10755 [Acidobacteriota bacterium]|nr:hypothetical protein [Acidobacteriota bacterium]